MPFPFTGFRCGRREHGLPVSPKVCPVGLGAQPESEGRLRGQMVAQWVQEGGALTQSCVRGRSQRAEAVASVLVSLGQPCLFRCLTGGALVPGMGFGSSVPRMPAAASELT